jgi:misacylated tRNA(Ala) deacylase
MTEALYLHDAYRTDFEAAVVSAEGSKVVLGATAFYPTGGGQPCDTGTLHGPDGREFRVLEVSKTPTEISHLLDATGPIAGSTVHGRIDWARRLAHMRHHTALHILSGVVFRRFGSGITGGQIYTDRARMDFSLPEFGREVAEDLIERMNEVVRQNLPVRVRFVSRAEILRDPSLVRVAAHLVPDVETIRLIDIEGFDVQADGGTHVRSTAEVGPARLVGLENKGSRNKRMTLVLGPPAALSGFEVRAVPTPPPSAHGRE